MSITKEKKQSMLTQMLGKDLEERLALESGDKPMGTLRKTSIKTLKEWGVAEKQAEQDSIERREQDDAAKAKKLEVAFMNWLSSFLPPGILGHMQQKQNLIISPNPAAFQARAQIIFQLPKCAPVLLSFEQVEKYNREMEDEVQENIEDDKLLLDFFRMHWGFSFSGYQMEGETGNRKPPFVFYSDPYNWAGGEGEEVIGWRHKYKANSLIDAIQKAGLEWPALKVARKELDEYLKQKDELGDEGKVDPLPAPQPPLPSELIIEGLFQLMDKRIDRALDMHFHEYHEGHFDG